MKIKGVFLGNNGLVMRYAQRITKSSLGLLFSRSGIKQKKLGSSKVNIRIKKDLMKHGECVLHKVFISYLVLGFLRISFIALFRRLQDRLGCPISYNDLVRSLYQIKIALATRDYIIICSIYWNLSYCQINLNLKVYVHNC